MRILHVIPSVSPRWGGPSFVIRKMAQGLAERGVETHVATTDDNGASRLDVPLDRPIVQDGVVYWHFRRQTSFYMCSLPFTKWLWQHAADYDLIHIHALFSYCSNVAAWIARRKEIPYIIRPFGVLNRWGMKNRRPRLKRLSFAVVEKGLLTSAAFVHYTSEQERIEASELRFSHNAVIIPNPVEASPASRDDLRGTFRAHYPQLAGHRLILFLSRIDQKKGLDLLIPAFRQVVTRYPNTVLVIAGDGNRNFTQILHRQVQENGVDDSVLWTGFLSGREKFAALADADIFVLPSYSENFGNAVVEAMALGVPVVITDQVGIHCEVAKGRAGLVTKAAVIPLANALDAMLCDDRLQSEFGSNARLLAIKQFSSEAVIDRVIDAYHIALRGMSSSLNAHPGSHRIV